LCTDILYIFFKDQLFLLVWVCLEYEFKFLHSSFGGYY